jgi:putative addiction module component (TIGR02574 family)
MSLTLEQFGIDQLSPDQRMELISLIWDSLPDNAPLTPPDWHLKLFDERLAEADANPGNVVPWEVVKETLFKSNNERV